MTHPIEELVKEGERLLALDNPVANAHDMADLIRDLLPVVKDAERYRCVREIIRLIVDDEAGLSGVAFSHQIPIRVIKESDDASLLDIVTDAALASERSAAGGKS